MPKVGGKKFPYTAAGMKAAKKAAAKSSKPRTGIRSDDDSMIEDRRPRNPGGDEGVRRRMGQAASSAYAVKKAFPKNTTATATKRAKRMSKPSGKTTTKKGVK